MKKICYAIIVILLLSTTVMAKDNTNFVDSSFGGIQISDWDYEIDERNGYVILQKYISDCSEVYVPGCFEIENRTYTTMLNASTVFKNNNKIVSVSFGTGVTFLENSMYALFASCTSLKNIDLSNVNSSIIRDMSHMFYNCSALEQLDVSALDTSTVITMRSMFYGCKQLANLTGYENWNTGSLENVYLMFSYLGQNAVNNGASFKLDLSKWDMDQAKNTAWWFQYCFAHEIILPTNLKMISAGLMNHATKLTGSTFTIPASIQKIGYAHTFYDFATNDFTTFLVEEGNQNYKAVDGILYSMDGTEMLAIPRNKTFENGIYEIPEGVTFLGELSFSRNYNISTLVLPDSYEIEYVPLYDDRYIVYEDRGNLNAGTNLSIAIYYYTGVTTYVVKDTNPLYKSIDGVIYSKDMTHLIAVPARYAQSIVIPEGVTHWDMEAIWVGDSTVADDIFANCAGVSLPSTLTWISLDQLEVINHRHAIRMGTSNPFQITITDGNTAFWLDDEGFLHTCLWPDEDGPIRHNWTEATCETPRTCTTCQKTEGSSLGHKWVDATCETAKTCSVCQKTEGSALGHKWVDATCETAKTCSVCQKTVGTALGHKSTWA